MAISNKEERQYIVSASYEDEILLTVPKGLVDLEKDEYLLVCLNKNNSDIVEECIKVDSKYQSRGKSVMEGYFRVNDFSIDAYYEIIRLIAAENSTRTKRDAIKCLAAYCEDPENDFIRKIDVGAPELVDDLIHHLVKNGFRKDKSLASKVCRYLNEWEYNGTAYTINDSVVRAILPYYLAYYKVDKALWQGKKFDDLSYVEFYKIFSQLREKVQVLNNHQLDHLIWYSYKNDSIRSEIAKALARVL